VDVFSDMTVDAFGDVYVTGTTASTNYPTAQALQPVCVYSPTDAYITKIRFSISPLAPTLTTVSPNLGAPNTTVNVTLTGTDFVVNGTSVLVSGSGVAVTGVNVSDSNSLTASFTINGSASTGIRTVTVETANGESNGLPFEIQNPPTITSINIANGDQGTFLGVTDGHELPSWATTVAVGGFGVAASNVNVLNATSPTVLLTVDEDATTGARNITVTTPPSALATL